MSRLPSQLLPLRTPYRRWRGDLERDVGDLFPWREQHLVRRTSGGRHDVAGANGLARRTARGTASPFTRGALGRALLHATGEDCRASGLDDEEVGPRVVALEASGRVAMRDRVREVRAASKLRRAGRSRCERVAELFETLRMHDLGGCGRAALCRKGARGRKQQGEDASTGHDGLTHGFGIACESARVPLAATPSHLNATNYFG